MPDDLAYAVPLRAALDAAGYVYDAVVEALGAEGHAALSRNETVPGERATRGGSPRETLTRLFLLQLAVPASHADAALPGLVDRLCAAGLLRRSVGEVAARVDVRPYATDAHDLWVASDLTPGLDGAPHRVSADHVLGISSASTTLAELTVREDVGRALDLGTGCGVQALHLAAHADHVVATDVNERALWLTRLNAVLNDVEIDVRAGDFYTAVRGERFDLVTTNPPFVISPATGERLVYRDSGLPGDRVVEHVVRRAPDHLVEGGIAQVLGNWMVLRDQPWEERLAGWVAGHDAWVVQRELVDLPTYVELWLKDAGLHGTPEYTRRYDTWLSWFADQGAEAVGFGWVALRSARGRTGTAAHTRFEHWPYEVQLPLGDEVAAHFRRGDLADDDLTPMRLVRAPDVVQETVGVPGAEDPQRIVLRRQTGVRRARPVDTAEAALVGACDGDLTVGQILAAIDDLLGGVSGGADRMPAVRELLADGFLTAETSQTSTS